MSQQNTSKIPEHVKAKLLECLQKAYSPYSKIQVAAAIEYVLDDITHYAYGVNIENASYGLTICAERSAVSNAIVEGMQNISAVYLMSNLDEAISPCGACRQVLSEFMQNQDAIVISGNQQLSKFWQTTLGELLPNKFAL